MSNNEFMTVIGRATDETLVNGEFKYMRDAINIPPVTDLTADIPNEIIKVE